ncbi:MAG: tetratricopeptide repeat protein [Elusimicrobiota bacterium]
MGRPRPSLSFRLAALALGCAATLLLFEAAFRVIGAGLQRARTARDDAKQARFTILCEGDSFTYGLGGEDYPGHLELALNRRAGRPLYRVINKGLPGMNTAVLADGLERRLERYRPDVLIVLAGEDNAWNTLGLEAADGGAFPHRADRLLLRSRVYKFVKMMALGLRRDGFSHDRTGEAHQQDGFPTRGRELYLRAQALEERREYAPARRLYEEFAALNPEHPAGWGHAAGCLMKEGRLAEAVPVFERALRLEPRPETEMIYFELGYALLRLGKEEQAVRRWREGQERFPGSSILRQALARYRHKREPDNEEPRTGLRQFMARPAPGGAGEALETQVSKGLLRDVRRIAAIAERRGVRVLFASYPDHVYPEVEAGAQEANARFVDLRGVFKSRFKSRAEYISEDDCHPNTAGYRVIAETLAAEITPAVEEKNRR